MSKKVLKEIESKYFNKNIPGSFSGPTTFGRLHPEFKKKDILQFFHETFANKSIFPNIRQKRKVEHHNISHYFCHRVNVDLTFFRKNVILIVGDTFSKFFSATIIKGPNSKSVLKGFKSIYENEYKPYFPIPIKSQMSVLVDNGVEFKSVFKAFCTKNYIHLETVYNHTNFAEFLARLLKNRLRLLFLNRKKKSFNYQQSIKDITHSWNITPNVNINNTTPLAIRNREVDAIKLASSAQFSWEQRQKHFEESIKLYKNIKRGTWVRLIRTARSRFELKHRRERRFEKPTDPITNPLILYQIRHIRWPSIENKTFAPYIQISTYDGKKIPFIFNINDIIISKKNPKSDSFIGTIYKIKKSKKEGYYVVNFSGKIHF